jgi:hypothetical protein
VTQGPIVLHGRSPRHVTDVLSMALTVNAGIGQPERAVPIDTRGDGLI